MVSTDSSRPAAISLEDLVALNDEIAALVRSGVPLEPALAALGSDMPGRLGRMATELSERAARGQPLDEVLADASVRMPPVYRAVVEAGLRSGRLPAALESLAGSIRRVADTRGVVATAALYPLLVVMVAWVLFAFFYSTVVGRMADAFAGFDLGGQGLLGRLAGLGEWAQVWGPGGLALMAILGGAWWYASSRATLVEVGWSGRLMGWLPWVGRSLRWSRTATFAEVLALLVESSVPLDEAVVLAAETTGDALLVSAAGRWAAAIRQGRTLDREPGERRLPPVLSWLMATAARHGALLPALRHAAESYHRRAQHQADLARVFVPMVLTVVVGGGVALGYVLTIFLPYATMLDGMGHL